eukprot:1557761-Prorocentrum_lima.AAC.1
MSAPGCPLRLRSSAKRVRACVSRMPILASLCPITSGQVRLGRQALLSLLDAALLQVPYST